MQRLRPVLAAAALTLVVVAYFVLQDEGGGRAGEANESGAVGTREHEGTDNPTAIESRTDLNRELAESEQPPLMEASSAPAAPAGGDATAERPDSREPSKVTAAAGGESHPGDTPGDAKHSEFESGMRELESVLVEFEQRADTFGDLSAAERQALFARGLQAYDTVRARVVDERDAARLRAIDDGFSAHMRELAKPVDTQPADEGASD